MVDVCPEETSSRHNRALSMILPVLAYGAPNTAYRKVALNTRIMIRVYMEKRKIPVNILYNYKRM
jgi:hypothetical protein